MHWLFFPKWDMMSSNMVLQKASLHSVRLLENIEQSVSQKYKSTKRKNDESFLIVNDVTVLPQNILAATETAHICSPINKVK